LFPSCAEKKREIFFLSDLFCIRDSFIETTARKTKEVIISVERVDKTNGKTRKLVRVLFFPLKSSQLGPSKQKQPSQKAFP
jgi:hypothetical protein